MKKLMIIGMIMVSIITSVGCTSRSGNVNTVNGEVIDRLPKEQKESEIDKVLTIMRKQRKEGYSEKNGVTTAISARSDSLPGQSKNMPDFSSEEQEKWQQLSEVVTDYLENELKIPKRPVYGYDVSQCLDPRINTIYDSEDKGVANGYKNENIYIQEYETEVDDVYSYIFLVRDSKESPWKVIHQGNSYKE